MDIYQLILLVTAILMVIITFVIKHRIIRIISSVVIFGMLFYIIAISFDGAFREVLMTVSNDEQTASAVKEIIQELRGKIIRERISVLILGVALLALAVTGVKPK